MRGGGVTGVSERVENAISCTDGTNASSANVASVVVDARVDNDANAHIDFMSQPGSKSSTGWQQVAPSAAAKDGFD